MHSPAAGRRTIRFGFELLNNKSIHFCQLELTFPTFEYVLFPCSCSPRQDRFSKEARNWFILKTIKKFGFLVYFLAPRPYLQSHSQKYLKLRNALEPTQTDHNTIGCICWENPWHGNTRAMEAFVSPMRRRNHGSWTLAFCCIDWAKIRFICDAICSYFRVKSSWGVHISAFLRRDKELPQQSYIPLVQTDPNKSVVDTVGWSSVLPARSSPWTPPQTVLARCQIFSKEDGGRVPISHPMTRHST